MRKALLTLLAMPLTLTACVEEENPIERVAAISTSEAMQLTDINGFSRIVNRQINR